MSFSGLAPYLFTAGSSILILVSLIAMLIHQKVDGYSIKYDRLSYTGVRQDFIHPVRKTFHKKSSYPEIFNLSLIIPGILYFFAFMQLQNQGIVILGAFFSIVVFTIGLVDVSTNYHLHNGAVIISQPIFLSFLLYILFSDFNWLTFATFILILILVSINVYRKQLKNRNPEMKISVIPQKLFIYFEALYFIVFPLYIV